MNEENEVALGWFLATPDLAVYLNFDSECPS
jgi:hypothetical protein